MQKENSYNWKRISTMVILLYGALKFSGHIYSILYAYFKTSNPLIPDYFNDFIAFPHYFLIPVWGIALWLGWLFYKQKRYEGMGFWYIIAALVFMMLFEGLLYQILMRINPYANP